MIYSFPPVHNPESQQLILGSMPGGKSLEAGQYYAHPRNTFWTILSAILNIPVECSYNKKIQALNQANIALWDVLKCCERQGSLDSDIVHETIQINDFKSLFQKSPKIQAIWFNGAKAEQVYLKHVLPTLPESLKRIPNKRLPSTSPAYAMMSLEQKQSIWILNLRPFIDKTKLQ